VEGINAGLLTLQSKRVFRHKLLESIQVQEPTLNFYRPFLEFIELPLLKLDCLLFKHHLYCFIVFISTTEQICPTFSDNSIELLNLTFVLTADLPLLLVVLNPKRLEGTYFREVVGTCFTLDELDDDAF
jgi:hypothetical protein